MQYLGQLCFIVHDDAVPTLESVDMLQPVDSSGVSRYPQAWYRSVS